MADLKMFLFGSPRIEREGAPVDIDRRKAAALLAYLAVTGQPHSRESLAALFWPEADQSRAYAYLRTMLWTLHKSLGEGLLDVERETVGLRPEAGLWLDVAEFRRVITENDDLDALCSAVALYRGDFLAGFTLPDSPAFDEWQTAEQESLKQAYAGTLERLAAGYVARGGYRDAIPYAQRWLSLDPLHEAAHRALMRLYYWSRQRSAALRQYQDCAALLDAELGVEPEAETTALYEAILEKRLPVPEAGPQRAAVQPVAPVSPPAAVLDAHLPPQSTPFVGREQELADIAHLLDDPACRLLTFVGTGGTGKTRLALQVAAAVRPHFADGAYFVPLAPVTSAEFIVPAVADAVRFTAFRQGTDARFQLFGYLAEKHMLLVMDNFEHVLDGAELLSDLLIAAPRLKILVTSRERLRLQEEWIYEIQGLAYPRNGSTGGLDRYDAVQLFLQSARRVRPDFTLADPDRLHVARICRLVEGLPLGLELAAAWLQMLSPREIAAEIEQSLDFLSDTVRNLPARHRSVRAVFESSWERLSPEEQNVLKKLAVFKGGFQREAAQSVAGASLPLLLALVGKSLLRRGAAGHYEMHELLRQFAEEKLNGGPQEQFDTHERHCLYYAAFLRNQEAALKDSRQLDALNAIEADIDNLRAAWEWAFKHRKLDAMRGLMASLPLFYMMRSRLQESREMLTRAIDYLKASPTEAETVVLTKLRLELVVTMTRLNQWREVNTLYSQIRPALQALDDTPENALYFLTGGILTSWRASEAAEARYWIERAMPILQAQNDRWGVSLALRLMGDVVHGQVLYYESDQYYRQSLALSREIGDQWGESSAVKSVGEVAYSLGNYPEAERLYREGLALSEAVGDRNGIAWGLDRVGTILSAQGYYDEARQYTARAIAVQRQLGDRGSLAWSLFNIGGIALFQERYDEARQFYNESLAIFRALGSRNDPAWVQIYLSRIAYIEGDYHEARRLAQGAFDQIPPAHNLWTTCACHYYIGEAACALGDFDAARHHLLLAVKIAYDLHSIIQILRHLVGAADLLARADQPERAVEVLAFIDQHPAAWQETKDWGNRLLSELTAELPPDVIRAAQERGRQRRLDDVVAEVMEEMQVR